MPHATQQTLPSFDVNHTTLSAAYNALFTMSDQAIIFFGDTGVILCANQMANSLFFGDEDPTKTHITELFESNVALESQSRAALGDAFDFALPFLCDGSLNICTQAKFPPGFLPKHRRFLVRAKLIEDAQLSSKKMCVLCAQSALEEVLDEWQFDRELRDLRRSNKRLSGAFNIILSTLDITDISSFLSNLFEEINDTMEADATLVYLWEQDGFYLRASSSDAISNKTPRFLSHDGVLELLFSKNNAVARLRLLTPTPELLREGALEYREVLNETDGRIIQIASKYLPPFVSFMVLPVLFSGHIIALIEVGWRRFFSLHEEDARLLHSVGRYLSVQLAGVIGYIQSERAQKLRDLRSRLHELFLPSGSDDTRSFFDRLREVSRIVEKELDAYVIQLVGGAVEGVYLAEMPHHGMCQLPVDLIEAESPKLTNDTKLREFSAASPLSSYLANIEEADAGVVLDMGELEGEKIIYLVLRDAQRGPFEETELDFLRDIALDVRKATLGEEMRVRDSFISQALQSGMKNELQQIEGICAYGVYSSATATAYVGGDFYDLIRLPEHRACAIMGDVSGKGVEAASVSAAVKTALGAYSWEGLSPAHMVHNLNDFLVGFSRLETFATLFVGLIDMQQRTITYCSAGHPPALLIRRSSDIPDTIIPFDVQSGFVGAFENMSYKDTCVELKEGDVLLLYTDGSTEARNPAGEFFGEEGLRELVMRESAGQKPYEGFCERILEGLDTFSGHLLKDDIALLSLRFDFELYETNQANQQAI